MVSAAAAAATAFFVIVVFFHHLLVGLLDQIEILFANDRVQGFFTIFILADYEWEYIFAFFVFC